MTEAENQIKRFKTVARDFECDVDEHRLEERLKKLLEKEGE